MVRTIQEGFRDVRSFTFDGYSTRLRARCMHSHYGKWLSASCSVPLASPCLIDRSTIISGAFACATERNKTIHQNTKSELQESPQRLDKKLVERSNAFHHMMNSSSDASHESEGQDAFPKEESLKKPSIARYFLCCVFFFQ